MGQFAIIMGRFAISMGQFAISMGQFAIAISIPRGKIRGKDKIRAKFSTT